MKDALRKAFPIKCGDFWWPGLAAVSTEARQAMMKYYQYCKGEMDEYDEYDPILVDWKRDMILYDEDDHIIVKLAQTVFYDSLHMKERLFFRNDCKMEIAMMKDVRKLYMKAADPRNRKHDMADWMLVWENGK